MLLLLSVKENQILYGLRQLQLASRYETVELRPMESTALRSANIRERDARAPRPPPGQPSLTQFAHVDSFVLRIRASASRRFPSSSHLRHAHHDAMRAARASACRPAQAIRLEHYVRFKNAARAKTGRKHGCARIDTQRKNNR